MERAAARYVSETQADTSHHGPPSVDRLVVHERRTSSATTSPDNRYWLNYSRHHSVPSPGGAVDGPHDAWAATADVEDDDDEQSTFRSDGSTPEPPLSARPKNLVNHPKILKDQLHRSMATLGTTHDVKFLNRSWTFSGR